MRVKCLPSKNTTQCPRPGLEPEPLDLELSTLNHKPPRLQYPYPMSTKSESRHGGLMVTECWVHAYTGLKPAGWDRCVLFLGLKTLYSYSASFHPGV